MKKSQSSVVNLNALSKKEHQVVMGIAKRGIIGLYDVMEILLNSETGLSELETSQLLVKLEEAPRQDPSKWV